MRDCLEHLEVDAARMRANVDLTRGAILSERGRAPVAGTQAVLDPAGYLGSAEAFVDRALAAHARRRGRR